MNRKILWAAGIVAAALVAALVVSMVAGGLDRTTTARPAGSGRQVVTVELIDSYAWFDISPDVIEVASGTELVLDVVNRADGAHDLEVAGLRTRTLQSGESERLDLGVVTESIDARCTIGDHDAAGMTFEIRVAR
jgi:nitrite reductase (NO-forming)